MQTIIVLLKYLAFIKKEIFPSILLNVYCKNVVDVKNLKFVSSCVKVIARDRKIYNFLQVFLNPRAQMVFTHFFHSCKISLN